MFFFKYFIDLLVSGCSRIRLELNLMDDYNDRPCPTLEQKRYAVLSFFHALSARDRIATKPRRKERSSAQCAAAGLRSAFQRRARPFTTMCKPMQCLVKQKQTLSKLSSVNFVFLSGSDLHSLTLYKG